MANIMYDVIMNETENKRPRGRPPLSTEEKTERQKVYTMRSNESHKKSNYAASKKHRQLHPENYQVYYEPKVRIPKELRPVLKNLIAQTGLSITKLFVQAVEEKYGVVLHTVDTPNED